MAWYKTGTVSVTNNSATVTGSGTNFVSGAQVGFGFQGPNGLVYEITAINSSTSLTITPVYGGSTASGQAYAIVPTQGLTAALASDVTDLITDYQTVADNAGAGKFGDGSAASPGIRFVNDQDTGFFKDTANEIAVSVGGTKVGEFTSTGIDGTVIGGTTPAAITATTFTSTGIDDNAASTALTIDSSGATLLGTTSAGSAGAGDLVVNGGVYLGGTGSANKLDDYEEGTWTPTLTTDGTNFTSVTYDGITSGSYTKVGNLVHVQFTFRTDAVTVGSASGSVRLGGLPFTAKTGNGGLATLSISSSASWSGEQPTAILIISGTNTGNFVYRTAADGDLSNTAVADVNTGLNANLIRASGTYLV